MSKSILAIALCILFVATISASVELSWATDLFLQSDKFVHNTIYPVNIKTSGINTNAGITFTAQQKDGVDSADTDRYWTFATSIKFELLNQQLSFYGIISIADTTPDDDSDESLSVTPCYDSKTKQLVADLEFVDADEFTLKTRYTTLFADKDGNYPALDVICFILPAANNRPNVDNIAYTATKNDASTEEGDISLPIKETVTPHVNFKSLSYDRVSDVQASSKFDIEFTTDTLGAHKVDFVNGFYLANFDLKDGKAAPFYCSAGSDKQFAVISLLGESDISATSAAIHITKLPASGTSIKCTFYTIAATDQFVRSERSSITIAIGNTSVARSFDLKLYPGIMRADLTTASEDAVTVEVFLETGMTSTPINVNSTIEFVFSGHFDASQYISFNPEYRKFQCNDGIGPVIDATASVVGNTIVLKDVNVVAGQSANSLVCEFTFKGSDIFDYDGRSKMGSVEVKVDGASLRSQISPGHTCPLYLTAQFDVKKTYHYQTETATEIDVQDVFTITDKYDTTHVTPRSAVLLLSLTGRTFTQDDAATQLKCLISSPIDSALTEIKLSYDPVQLNWSAPLKDITNVETFSLELKCTHKVKTVTQYGLNVTPKTTLYVEVFDLVDKKRFNIVGTGHADSSSLTVSQPNQKPSSFNTPGKSLGYVDFSDVSIVARGVAVDNDEAKAAAVDFANNFASALAKQKANLNDADATYKDFKFAVRSAVGSRIALSSTQYTNVQAASAIDQFAHTTLKIPYVFSEGTTDTNPVTSQYYNTPETTPYTSHRPNAQTTTPSVTLEVTYSGTAGGFTDENSFTTQRALFDENVAKVRGTDFVQDVPGKSWETGDAYFATPVTGCGVQNGFTLNTATYDLEIKEWDDIIAHAGKGSSWLCDLKEKCTMDADCSASFSGGYGANVCKAGVCTLIPRSAPTWIRYNRVTSHFMLKEYFNSAPIVASSLAIVIAVVALMF